MEQSTLLEDYKSSTKKFPIYRGKPTSHFKKWLGERGMVITCNSPLVIESFDYLMALKALDQIIECLEAQAS